MNCTQCDMNVRPMHPGSFNVQKSHSTAATLLNATEKLASAVANNLKPGETFTYNSTNIGMYVCIVIIVTVLTTITALAPNNPVCKHM